MALLAWPPLVKIAVVDEWDWLVMDQVFSSPFSAAEQVDVYDAPRWTCRVTLSPMLPPAWRQYSALVRQLRGRTNTVRVGPEHAKRPAAPAEGAPVVAAGAAVGAATLATEGWLPGARALGMGDYVEVEAGGRPWLYEVMADAVADGAGAATLQIAPGLHAAPGAGAPLATTSPATAMRMVSASAPLAARPGRGLQPIGTATLEFVEVLGLGV